ncbi:MAG: YbhB/YbcL family Raf kinase inhibitor-like protein [Candidatus Parabeggiatoa sp. nov. 3]|jgi:Raf kinase inhibitor-like YbhB/YbcL family protein|nr:MAG: YbhB/YbcL family Raf kinase inhibitor-like protein [Gammaproteobacteria bacterium]RKZ55407.1 MAG: YbhB/YbcL family Raf kinase inhibitor-like protein [Gammaproteobacteria bacterium]RKZ84616.1 MAG: YbhB/YbcL family Raf kinase inhibitor-like protein [Gammaproteobacteria bacterium]HEW99018.1 YbhB/YbcL family Raf kinase inhibitor-like protein [Beggiatoa sp.]
MRFESSAFEHGGKIPSKYTCDGKNINPPFKIRDIPRGAKSLTLIMDDPDVPRHLKADGIWDHWVLFNMHCGLWEIREGEEPEGTQGLGTDYNLDYSGPCPPDTEHCYYFKLYALDTTLHLPVKSTKSQVEQAMEGHIMAQTELMGRYERLKR